MRTSPRIRTSLVASILALAAALAAPARASLIGGPGPLPGLNPDDGTELFVPNLNPIHQLNVVLVKEMFDPIPASIPHEWGIYFASDPGTRIPVFTSADSGSAERAVISFNLGVVADLDAPSFEASFPPSLAPFGFYLSLQPPGAGSVIRYSQASLNPGGVDAVATFPFQANPTYYFVGFEFGEKIFSLQIVDGVVPVPEAGVTALLGGGLALLAAGRKLSRG